MSESAIAPDSWDILNAIAEGESARSACKRAGITHWALLKRVDADPELAHQYARAQEARAEKFADEIVALADEAAGLDNAGVQAARLRVDARKWVASKLLPRVYGERVEHNVTGAIATLSRLELPPDLEQGLRELGARYARTIEVTPILGPEQHALPAAAGGADPPTGGE